ncbi:hypothetical protein K440DRAFT_611981 [Wilcoxina mikolae CBS 423.85]|nr:hypothetical protein K440DRAFT_611981 [Wilcoxina mikolae CBS 423.85]
MSRAALGAPVASASAVATVATVATSFALIIPVASAAVSVIALSVPFTIGTSLVVVISPGSTMSAWGPCALAAAFSTIAVTAVTAVVVVVASAFPVSATIRSMIITGG